ncbi:hypothetical protein AGLY_011910 [Aphis glycines]|uniref:Uncharacterized protein n=1 Tax=Aphis glycines TaxID=307491 RepID=A0A6G0TBG2_APHGL|nr:hypothetical protein AGLY_011910 [Aphis glycines]
MQLSNALNYEAIANKAINYSYLYTIKYILQSITLLLFLLAHKRKLFSLILKVNTRKKIGNSSVITFIKTINWQTQKESGVSQPLGQESLQDRLIQHHQGPIKKFCMAKKFRKFNTKFLMSCSYCMIHKAPNVQQSVTHTPAFFFFQHASTKCLTRPQRFKDSFSDPLVEIHQNTTASPKQDTELAVSIVLESKHLKFDKYVFAESKCLKMYE